MQERAEPIALHPLAQPLFDEGVKDHTLKALLGGLRGLKGPELQFAIASAASVAQMYDSRGLKTESQDILRALVQHLRPSKPRVDSLQKAPQAGFARFCGSAPRTASEPVRPKAQNRGLPAQMTRLRA